MMKKIANFTITSSPDKVIVNCKKTPKYWFDNFITIAIGLFFLVFSYFVITYAYETNSVGAAIAGIVLSLLTLYQWTLGISLLIQPAKNILIIDKKANRLLLKRTVFSTKSFPMDGIRNFEINKHKEKVYSGGSAWRSLVYCTIGTTIDKKDEVLLTVSSSRIFTVSDQKLEKELYELSKMISDEIYKRWKSKR